MRMITKEQLEALRSRYPAGTRVELLQMDDVQAPPIGTKGTVTGVDDTGSLMVTSTALTVCERWWTDMDEKVKEQILAIRDTGLTNMFDVNTVQRLAYELDFYELVLYLEDHRKEYVNFILTGEA